jgi:serine/threonine-protein kinase RsbW
MARRKFRARFEQLEGVRDFVARTARAAGFSDKAVYAVQLAADEAASNIIEHAYEGKPNATFELACDFEENRLIMRFVDQGKSFDFDRVDVPDLRADLSERKIGGLGIYLMHKLMDKVDYQITNTGNILTLTKQKA